MKVLLIKPMEHPQVVDIENFCNGLFHGFCPPFWFGFLCFRCVYNAAETHI